MSRTPRLTDALLREALTPARDLAPPNGLLATIGADVRRARQDRPLLTWWLASVAERWSGQAPTRRLAWLVTVGLVLALVAGALIGASRLYEPPTIEASATGIEVLTPESGGYFEVLVDGQRVSWAIGPGHVTRFEPLTGAHRTWTVSDDLAFGGNDLVPKAAARLGGLWIPAGTSIRRFDGTGFRESIPMPATDGRPITVLVEDPGGALWAGSDTGGPWRWDGSDWTVAPGGRPGDGVGSLVVAGDDTSAGGFPALWVGDWSASAASSIGTVSHLSGGRWTSYGWRDAPALAGQGVELLLDGEALWVSSTMGLARFVDGTWEPIEGPDGADVRSLTLDGDGALWAIPFGDEARLARYADGAWTVFKVDGLGQGWPLTVSATDAGVFVGTTDGLYHFADGRVAPVWPVQETGPRPYGANAFIAIDVDEAWATDERGVWHYVGGGWQGPEMPGSPGATSVRSLAAGPDGRVWAVTDRGVVVREDGRWTTAWSGKAGFVAVAPDGSAWIGGRGRPAKLVQVRKDRGIWTSRWVSCPAGGSSVTVTADGTVWTGGIGYSGTAGLARYDGRSCEAADPHGSAAKSELLDLAADSAGGLAALVDMETGGGPWSVRVMRFDGSSWSSLTPEVPTDVPFGDLAFGPTGELWLAGFPDRRGLQRYRNGAWQDVVPGIGVSAVSIAPDGTAWLGGSSGVLRIKPDALPD